MASRQPIRVLLAWELGANWGHLATLLPIARALRAKGHEPIFAVRSLDADLGALAEESFACLPYPMALAPLQERQGQAVLSHAEAMLRCGFGHADILSHLTHAWQCLLKLVQADLVVAKYAPLAEFATRDVPVVAIGTGFELPPLHGPLPAFLPAHVEDPRVLARLHDAEARIASSAMRVAGRYGWPGVERAADLLSRSRRLYLTAAQLDHFGPRPGVRYCGPLKGSLVPRQRPPHARGEPAANGKAKVFAYLRMGGPWWIQLGFQKRKRKDPTSWRVCDPTLSDEDCHTLGRLGIAASSVPVDLDAATDECAVVICHAGHGLVSWALSRECRLVLLPQYAEQFMLAKVLSSQTGQRVAALPFASPAAQLLDVVAAMLAMPPVAEPAPRLQLSDASQVTEEILRLA